MADRFTLDANVLVYALDDRYPAKRDVALNLIQTVQALPNTLVSITLGEFFWTVARKRFLPAALAKLHMQKFRDLFPVVSYQPNHMFRAADEVVAGRFSFWDAVMLVVAEEAGCTTCFSEDMGDGARLGNIVVCNPFGANGLSRAAREALGL